MVTVDGVLSGIGVAHQFASVETIAEATPASIDDATRSLVRHEDVSEAFLLATCNRFEAYVVAEDAETGRGVLRGELADLPDETARTFDHAEAVEHLVSVAAGLESQVLGEDEIIGQFRDAYHRTKDVEALGPVLDSVLLTALHVGERARSETAINEGTISLASAAATCAGQRCDLTTSTAVVVGAGRVGERSLHALYDRGADRVLLANRSVDRAAGIAAEVDGAEAIPLADLPDALATADVCITATSSREPVLDAATVPRRTAMVLIDLGQPPDVSPSVRERANVAYYDLDRLRRITERTHERRASAAEEVRAMVADEVAELERRFKRRQAESVIAAMRAGADRIKRRELERAIARLRHGDDEVEPIVEDLADAIVNALMAPPTEGLRDAAEDDDWGTINAAIQMFDPSLDAEDLPEALLEERAAATDD